MISYTRMKQAQGALSRPAPIEAPPSTPDRLLDAAEELFAAYGYNGVSVRDIVEAAKANLGAIPYHFGSKENLFKTVILRRAVPLREERAQLLTALRKRRKKPTVEEVLTALLEPAFRRSRENDAFRQLLGRASMDPTPEVRRLLAEIYSVDFMVVPKTLRALWPNMPDEEFHWKLHCFYGVMLFVQADTGKIQTIAGRHFDTGAPQKALKHVIPFLAAGFRARV